MSSIVLIDISISQRAKQRASDLTGGFNPIQSGSHVTACRAGPTRVLTSRIPDPLLTFAERSVVITAAPQRFDPPKWPAN